MSFTPAQIISVTECIIRSLIFSPYDQISPGAQAICAGQAVDRNSPQLKFFWVFENFYSCTNTNIASTITTTTSTTSTSTTTILLMVSSMCKIWLGS